MGFMEDCETSLRGFDTDISTEFNEIKRSVATSGKRATIRFSELKRIRYWYPLMVGIGLLLLQQLRGINGVLFYSSNIFNLAGISSSKAAMLGLGAIQCNQQKEWECGYYVIKQMFQYAMIVSSTSECEVLSGGDNPMVKIEDDQENAKNKAKSSPRCSKKHKEKRVRSANLHHPLAKATRERAREGKGEDNEETNN